MDAKSLLSIVSIGVFSVCELAGAYSVDTHRFLSRTAARNSIALGSSPGTFHQDIDLKRDVALPSNSGTYFRAVDLVGFGAVQEDDIPFLRMRNHFFDPQHGGSPLTIGIEVGFPSPDWILEDKGPLPDRFFRMLPQLYSMSKAQQYFREGLSASSFNTRQQNLGLLFQTIGHMVHHVQDMAQFEHVRNDQHIDLADTSLYEIWVKGRGRGIPVAGYPRIDLQTFRTARSFWSNQDKGIAEFTAHNFVSKDTNFTRTLGGFKSDPDYPLPAVLSDPPIEKVSLISLLGPLWKFLPQAQMWFIGLTVNDALRPELSRFNSRASTYSILDQDLAVRFSSFPAFFPFTTLNQFNFAAANEFLMPRAVAYSAGLIDYFFRGRLALDSFEAAGSNVTLKIRNVSAADFALRGRGEAGEAEFSLHYDAQDGTRRRLPLANDILGAQSMAVGATRMLSFFMPTDVARDVEKPFMLMFDGTIGEEKGIAALAIAQTAESRGLLVRPSYSPADGVSGSRLIEYNGSQWRLSERTNLLAGNVDWRGNESAEVLTWDGPPSRYFYPDGKRTGYSNAIYRHGALWTRAPMNVQGASIRDVNGVKFLTVVTHDGWRLQVYTRPFRDRYQYDAMYVADAYPDGWRLLYSVDELPLYTPAFFNASGTEVQVITTTGSARVFERVRLSLSGDTVARTAVSAMGRGRVEILENRTVVPSRRDLNTGERRVDETNSQNCSYEPACLNMQYCATYNVDVCMLAKEDFVSENRAEVNNATTFVFDTPTTVCVDYRGDQEVLCEVAYYGGVSSSLTATDIDRTSTVEEQTYNSCPELQSNTSTSTQLVNEHSSGGVLANSLRALKIGGLEIPLAGLYRTHQTQQRHVSTSNGQSYVYSGRKTQTNMDWRVKTRLAYVDARHSMVVYETDETKEDAVGIWDVAQESSWGPPGEWKIRETTNQEWIALIGGQKYSLRQTGNVRDSTVPALGGAPGGGYGVKAPQCSPVDIDEHDERGYEFTDTVDLSAILHPRANDATQSYGVDRNGRVAASQTIWIHQSDGAEVASGIWNFLSGGNLPQLLPVAPANASYFPIGVID